MWWLCLVHHISAVLKGLREPADRADNIFVAVDAEWDYRNEAEGKPRLNLDHARRIVALDFVRKESAIRGTEKGAHNSDSGKDPRGKPGAGM